MRLPYIYILSLILCFAAALPAATYFVDGSAEKASDDNPGSEARPWKTISRAGTAKELRPGDTVLIKSGVYREHVQIKVSGRKGNPITFAAAPGERVVIKGSEIVRGKWTKLQDVPNVEEPFPQAFTGVWKTTLGDEYFTDPRFEASYRDKSKRWVSQVFINDRKALQMTGLDRIYRNDQYAKLRLVGRDLSDIIDDSFYFDAADQSLYLKISGDPMWFSIEVGVRGFVLTAKEVHDVIIRGLEMRHNRQPGGQWPMVSIGDCERIVIEDCKVHRADFCGLSLGRSKDCVVRRCDLSYNGDTGFGMGQCEGCLIEDCTLLFNNYRHFRSGWHAGGMKCIPANKRCTVRGCEAAYNVASDGIWFDTENEDIRIIGNVSHHNDGCGIFFEINKGGGIIADNLVYSNRGRGIYISGSQNTWIVSNTVADNDCGIVCMPRGADWPLEKVHVLRNLLIGNYVAAEGRHRGCDLTLFMGTKDENSFDRTVMSNHSDYNLYANTSWTPTMRHSWNPDNTFEQWRERFGEDRHSKLAPISWEMRGTGFRLLTTEGLDIAGPLPPELKWTPADPRRVGCSRTEWPIK